MTPELPNLLFIFLPPIFLSPSCSPISHLQAAERRTAEKTGFHRKGAKSAKQDLRVLRAFAVRGIQTDANGNRTGRFVDTDSSGTLNAGDTSITEYTWDHRNRLTGVTFQTRGAPGLWSAGTCYRFLLTLGFHSRKPCTLRRLSFRGGGLMAAGIHLELDCQC